MKWTFTQYQMEKAEKISSKPSSTLKRFFTKPVAVSALVILVVIILMSFIIPLFGPDVNHLDPNHRHYSYGEGGHILGTDQMGRDIWVRLWAGFQLSLKIALLTVAADLVIGVVLGVIMGYFDGFKKAVDGVIKVLSSIPSILFALILAMIMQPSILSISIGLSITGWIAMARQVSTRIWTIRNAEFISASQNLATPNYKIISSIIPFALPIILTQIVFTISGALLADSALAIVGLKIIGQPSLGALLSDGQQYFTIFPHEIISPIVLIFVVQTSIILVGTGITDSQRRSR